MRYGTGAPCGFVGLRNWMLFFGVYILACGMYLGAMWVTKKALALIPIDVHVGGK